MAVKMRLTKAPTLQKLLVVTLLTLSGLGFPPPLTSATKCFKCGPCSGDEVETSCGGNCKVASNQFGEIEKDCSNSAVETIFQCVQRVLSQTGGCFRISTPQDLNAVNQNCRGKSGSRASEDQWPFGNLTSSAEGRQGKSRSLLEVCLCDTELCNTEALLGSGPGPVGPGPVGPGPVGPGGGGSKIKCYCENQRQFPGAKVSCSGSGEVECEPEYEACHLIKGPAGEVKGCDEDGFYGYGQNTFECVQKKYPGASKNCVKGTPGELEKTAELDCRSSGGYFSARDFGDEEIEICTCKTDLCNSGGGGGGSSGTGQGLLAGRNLIQVGITAAMITLLLVINGLYE